MINNKTTLHWLSHSLSCETPSYGDGTKFKMNAEKQLCQGDSCNSVHLSFPNHLGTHVDVPFHFIATGKRIEDYKPEDWIFNHVKLVTLNVSPDQIIDMSLIQEQIQYDTTVELLLIKTGFEQYRGQSLYWEHGPAYAAELAGFFKEQFPQLKAIGFDSISLTGYQHRQLGREAHRAFLQRDIRIFEDLTLAALSTTSQVAQVIALPLRFTDADGAPCTLIASII